MPGLRSPINSIHYIGKELDRLDKVRPLSSPSDFFLLATDWESPELVAHRTKVSFTGPHWRFINLFLLIVCLIIPTKILNNINKAL
jgi:hypothetical protein